MHRIKTALLGSVSLKSFRELADLDHSALQVLVDNAELRVGPPGSKLVELVFNDPVVVFLLQGSVSLEAGPFQKRTLRREDREARLIVNEALPKGGRVLAGEDAVLLLVKRKHIQAARLDYRQSLAALPLGSGAPGALESEGPGDDWMSVLLSSPLFQHMEPGKLQAFIASFRPRSCGAGQWVIRDGQRDEFFYIIKSGTAEVLLPGQAEPVARLGPGQFFGEGALLGESVHSASVRMGQAGELCLVTANDFERLLKQSLFHFVSEAELPRLPAPLQVLDARHAVEYRHGHREGSVHMPLLRIRERIASLPRDVTYVMDFGEDKRCQVAALILIENGYRVLLLRTT